MTVAVFERRRLAVAALALVGALVWTAFFFSGPGEPPPHSDAWDYFQMGRAIAEGGGFQSRVTYPILLSIDDDPPFPALWRPPLYPLVCSLPFLAMEEPPGWTPPVLSGFFHLLSGVLFFLFLGRFFSTPVSFFGGLVWILNPHLLDASLQGLSEPFYLCLCIGLFWTLAAFGLERPLTLGATFGLCWLTRSNTILFLPALLVFAWLESPRSTTAMKRLVPVTAAICLVCLPWWIRNWGVTGDPFFNMNRFLPPMFSEAWPGWSLFRTDFTSLEEAPRFDPIDSFVAGGAGVLDFAFRQRLLSGNPVLFVLALLGIFEAWKRRGLSPRTWRIAGFFAAADLATVVFFGRVKPDLRFYLPMFPLVTLFALLGLRALVDGDRGRRGYWIVAALLGLSVLVYAGRLASNRAPLVWETISPSTAVELKKAIPEDSILLSDAPGYLAWRLERNAVFLPTLVTVEGAVARWDGPVFVHFSPAFEEFLAGEGESAAAWRVWAASFEPLDQSRGSTASEGPIFRRIR